MHIYPAMYTVGAQNGPNRAQPLDNADPIKVITNNIGWSDQIRMMSPNLRKFLSGVIMAGVGTVPTILFSYSKNPLHKNFKALPKVVLSNAVFATLGLYIIEWFHLLTGNALSEQYVPTQNDSIWKRMPSGWTAFMQFIGAVSSSSIILILETIRSDRKSGITPSLTGTSWFSEDLKEKYERSRLSTSKRSRKKRT